MDIGFQTIGNATLIAFDHGPVLVTDPWIEGSAYFGSWTLSCNIPVEQKEAVLACPYVWFSHGHPDHLNPESLHLFKEKTILLPDHYGMRIKEDLEKMGFKTQMLPERKWVKLTDRIRICCLTNSNQDAILLLDINGRLAVNLNDVSLGSERQFILSESKKFPTTIALAYAGYGDADMIHIFNEEGELIPSIISRMGKPLGDQLADIAEAVGAKYFIPFSAMHRYQRTDSLWANEYLADPKELQKTAGPRAQQILPMYLSYDCSNDSYAVIKTESVPDTILSPETFGDNWADELTSEDRTKLKKYIESFQMLSKKLDFIHFEVGGKTLEIPLKKKSFKRGITFKVPRHSLMTCVEYEIFDDLLIGNFMKTVLHGKWNPDELYGDFSVYVGKYGDNGRVKSQDEIRSYLRTYAMRNPIESLFGAVEEQGKSLMRSVLPKDSALLQNFKKVYRKIKYSNG